MRYYDIQINDHETGAVASLRAHIGLVRKRQGLHLPCVIQKLQPFSHRMTGDINT